ncbi:hypothetical protein KP509_33G016900 [Ceratopteris richardii]|nr:hypothetical protein KP509_33G016900 [Ceratopteris richardii]
MTLFERVTKESRGCSTHDPLVGSLMCASERTDRFPKIMFMTDHALLQLCLVDELLNWFQCVIVDEAHERTLNTDLLLAMLKRCLDKRSDFKVIIMSATADGELLASYFGACAMYHVAGRNFPVEVIYETEEEDGQITDGNYHYWGHGRHVSKAVQKVKSIISESEKGDVLAFLTSQAEIEWACSQEYGPNILILPLHGRLQASEQQLVFKAAHDGMRKVVFATNIAETSLTIPGIKFVVDCGLVKESCVDPNNGMTILKICQIDKGAAMQRTGRAGRTEAGICYRLYKRDTFEAMLPHRIPEILRVHLGIAVLKLTALGVQKIETFDFIDSPSQQAICLAVENLTQLGAIRMKEDKLCLTPLGRKIAKLGVDPCLGYIVLKSLSEGLGKEGAVIAGLLSCSSFIFFRAGSEEEKLRSDCLKMRFCQPDGDIFTLLSVYQEWSSIPLSMRNKWCLQNSINVKSMRRCHDFIKDLKCSLRTELNTELPSQWTWYAGGTSCHLSVMLRKILLSSMPNNVAVFSGHDSTGYDVVITGKQAYLHPSSSCLVFGQYPTWIVFANLLCTSRAFLTLSIAVEPEWLSEINGALYDVAFLEARRMHKVIISDISRPLLMRICGKFNKSLKLLTEKIIHGSNQRCCLEADHEKRTISIYATLDLLGRARQLVDGAIEQERKWLNSFCVEKPIFQAFPGRSSPVILFGAGAVIKEVLMPGEFVRVEISNVDTFVEDQEVLNLFDMCSEGVAGFYRNNSPENNGKWGTITFNSQRGAAEAVSMLQDCKIGTFNVKVKPFVIFNPHDGCRNFFPVLRATLSWPRRQSSGHAVIRCKTEWERHLIIFRCSGLQVGGSRIQCRPDCKDGRRGVFVYGLRTGISEKELSKALEQTSGCVLEDVHVLRHPARGQPDLEACREALEQEIQQFVPLTRFKATVMCKDSDYFTKAAVSFDEREHESAARAIAHLQGRSLSVCQPWQIITCQNTFFSSMKCSEAIYSVLKQEISDLVASLKEQNEGLEVDVIINDGKGGCHVKISAGSLRTVAACKSALERLLEGSIFGEGLDEDDIQLMFTKEWHQIKRHVEIQTKTFVVFDKRNQTIKIFGSADCKNRARSCLLKNLLQLKEKRKCHDIELRGGGWPYGLMREVVKRFGVDLAGLKVLVTGRNVILDQRRHILQVHGSMEDMMKVKAKIEELAVSLKGAQDTVTEAVNALDCSICLCEVEEKYNLAGCGHGFCRVCIKEQIMSAIRHREGFPLTCAYPMCSQKLLLVDFEALLTTDQQEDLQRASLCAFVASSNGKYKFCVTPDCPSVYRVTEESKLFNCAACAIRLCTRCNSEYHPGLSCTEYAAFKLDPDLSLKSWCHGKQHVKCCPSCGSTIEKVEGCNHVLCNCKAHLCWLCLCSFKSGDDCYAHLQNVHGSIGGFLE